jgi:RND family efflux transporter MFP subunit
MTDHNTAALLSQLKLDREAARPTRWWPWIALVIGLLATAGWFFRGKKASTAESPPAASIPPSPASAAQPTPLAASASALDASGYVVARRQATVSSKSTGKVLEVSAEEGQPVKKGAVLARLDTSNLDSQALLSEAQIAATEAQLAEVQANLSNAERDLSRQRDLRVQGWVSQAAVDNASTQVIALKGRLNSTQKSVDVARKGLAVVRQQLLDAVILAPFDGVITSKNAQPGEMISPLSAGGAGTRTGIATVVDMSSLEIEVDVNESFLNKVTPGQAVQAKLNAYPDLMLPAKVLAIIPAADRSKATVKVRVGFEKLDPRILPDMGVRVSFLAVK